MGNFYIMHFMLTNPEKEKKNVRNIRSRGLVQTSNKVNASSNKMMHGIHFGEANVNFVALYARFISPSVDISLENNTRNEETITIHQHKYIAYRSSR